MLDALRTRLRSHHHSHSHSHAHPQDVPATTSSPPATATASADSPPSPRVSMSRDASAKPDAPAPAMPSARNSTSSPRASFALSRPSADGSPPASPRRSLNGARLSRNLGSIRHKLHDHLHLGHHSSHSRLNSNVEPDASSASAGPDSEPALAGERGITKTESNAPSALTSVSNSSAGAAGPEAIPARFRSLFSNNGRLHEPGSGNLAQYPHIADLLPLYGTATNTAWTEPMYTIFELSLPEDRRHDSTVKNAYVGYLQNTPDGKQTYAIAWGNPLCHPDNYAYVAQRWVHKIESEGKRPLWSCCSQDFMDVLTKSFPHVIGGEAITPATLSTNAKLDWSALTCIHEDVVDPRSFTVDQVEKFVRTKLRKAHRKGLRIVEAHGRFPDPRLDGSNALSRDHVEEGILVWKESKAAKGNQIHASDTEPWRDLTHRKYFYAVAPKTPPADDDDEGPQHGKPAAASAANVSSGKKSAATSQSNLSVPNVLLDFHDDEKVVGMCVLAPIAQGKYVVKWLLEFDQDVKGTSECLIVHVIERLRDAGSPDWPTPQKKSAEDDKPLSNREKARRARKARMAAAAAKAQQEEEAAKANDTTDAAEPGEETPPPAVGSDVAPGKVVAVNAPVETIAEVKADDASPPEKSTINEAEAKTEKEADKKTPVSATVIAEQDSKPMRVQSTATSVDASSAALFPLEGLGSTPAEWNESKRPVCTSLSFGISGGELKPVRNMHVGLRFTTISAAYNALSKTFHLGSKGSFRTKFGASHEVTAYICFPQGSMGYKMIDAIVGALKEDQSSETDVEKIIGNPAASGSDGPGATTPASESPKNAATPLSTATNAPTPSAAADATA